MDNLRDSIRLIFGKQCPDKVLAFNENEPFGFSQSDFIEKGYHLFQHYGLEEIVNVYKKLDEDWFKDYYSQDNNVSIFNLLIHFSKQVLTENNLEPYVEYRHLLKWRDLSHELGEDLFTCSYLAYMDVRSKRRRDFFAWRPVISTNNRRLRVMLNEGIAENHFHLKGSGPVFDLSWMALMNCPSDHDAAFRTLKADIKLFTSFSNSFSTQQKELDVLVLKAAYIRYWLFSVLNNISSENFDFDILRQPSNRHDSYQIVMNRSAIEGDIEALRFLYGYQFQYNSRFRVADYAIPKELAESNFDGSFLLAGERIFLYHCFKIVYSGANTVVGFNEALYAYLLIKCALRSELIQINLKTGFGNFLKYQDRKEIFIPAGSIYETAFVGMAVNDTLKFNNIKSFETRIAPKASEVELRDSLERYNLMTDIASIQGHHYRAPSDRSEILPERHFYTLHFIKKHDAPILNPFVSSVTPRHHKLREEVKKQAMAIVNLRESFYEKSQMIRGIDAASSEFAAKPEVFAHAFRYLKDHKLSGAQNHLKDPISEYKLSATFHVGEDFFDIVDGMRSIDEAILFLDLKQGDRLGHALALGIDVTDFYKLKKRKLMLPKEILLDNIVWLLARIRKFGIDLCRTEVNRLEKMYEGLFREIYTDSFDDSHKEMYCPHTTFFDAWKLRGDDPSLYKYEASDNHHQEINLTYWGRCRINYSYPTNSQVRLSPTVKWIYQQYHFNPRVKLEGLKIRQFEITSDYIKLVGEVQKRYLNFIKTLNLGIECNPTSNFLIGTFRRYANHPILRFYDLGLQAHPTELTDCPQLFVSINTDDQGIFSTSLENEYALLAIALEKEFDASGDPRYSPTMIYQWLDNIRRMGLQQSFNIR